MVIYLETQIFVAKKKLAREENYSVLWMEKVFIDRSLDENMRKKWQAKCGGSRF